MKVKYGSKINIPFSDGTSDEITLWDRSDVLTLSFLLKGEIVAACMYKGRYVFKLENDEINYIIDPKTKRVECIDDVGGGIFIYDQPDAVKISPEELRRALS